MFSEEILGEIDLTLDRLIENATAMKDFTLLKEEVKAFQKTQESLLEHLIHMDELLEEKRKKLKIHKSEQKRKIINQKLNQFEKLNYNFIKNVFQKISLIKRGKNKKSFKPTL